MIYEGNGLCLTIKEGESVAFIVGGITVLLTLDDVSKSKGQVRFKASQELKIKRVKKEIESEIDK